MTAGVAVPGEASDDVAPVAAGSGGGVVTACVAAANACSGVRVAGAFDAPVPDGDKFCKKTLVIPFGPTAGFAAGAVDEGVAEACGGTAFSTGTSASAICGS